MYAVENRIWNTKTRPAGAAFEPTMGLDTLSVYGYDQTDTIFGLPGNGATARMYNRNSPNEQKIWTVYEGRPRLATGMDQWGRYFADKARAVKNMIGHAASVTWSFAKKVANKASCGCVGGSSSSSKKKAKEKILLPGEKIDKKTGDFSAKIPQPWEHWK